MELQPTARRHPNWGSSPWPVFNDLQLEADRLVFHSSTDEQVVARFETVKKLISYSYFEWDFLHIALEHALLTYEMALRRRYRALFGTPGQDLTHPAPDEPSVLHNLIGRAHKKGMFGASANVLHSLRKLRNYVAHPVAQSSLGILSLSAIARTVECINELCIDPEIRRRHNDEKARLNHRLRQLTRGGVFLDDGTLRVPIVMAELLHIDGMASVPGYVFGFIPLFERFSESNDTVEIQPHIAKCSSWEGRRDGSISLSTHQGSSLLVDRNLTLGERAVLDPWRQDGHLYELPFPIDLYLSQLRRAALGLDTLLFKDFSGVIMYD